MARKRSSAFFKVFSLKKAPIQVEFLTQFWINESIFNAVTTDLQWRENGELHPDELERLQQLLSNQIQGQSLEFQALDGELNPRLQGDRELLCSALQTRP